MSSPTKAPDWAAIAADLFDSPDALNIEDALVKAYARGLADGAERERAAIKTWLDGESETGLADYIENGLHLAGESE